uniref:Uncharacterized protein n=1 Tax=Ditylenchus dipsaci TaxID=166011 RepID=A0A915CVT5_9BILA
MTFPTPLNPKDHLERAGSVFNHEAIREHHPYAFQIATLEEELKKSHIDHFSPAELRMTDRPKTSRGYSIWPVIHLHGIQQHKLLPDGKESNEMAVMGAWYDPKRKHYIMAKGLAGHEVEYLGPPDAAYPCLLDSTEGILYAQKPVAEADLPLEKTMAEIIGASRIPQPIYRGLGKLVKATLSQNPTL